MTKQRIAVVKGVFARPGVSKNGRLYSATAIAEAANEAQSQIDSGNAPAVFGMMTHHGARGALDGDVTRTAGRLTKVGVSPEGYGTFEAELADTQAGRDVAALVTPEKPYLKGVSMASMWKGRIRNVQHNGESAVTADGFSLKGIDFTHNPGVMGAEVTETEIAEAAGIEGLLLESIDEGDVFVETVDGDKPFLEAAVPTPTPGGSYADPGYQADKKKRYPLDSKAHVQAAWSYINVAKNAAVYSAKQLNRIKSKVKAAASKFGITISEATVADDEFIEAYQALCLDTDAIEADGSDDMDGDADTCPNCGTPLPDDAKVCPQCSTPVNESAIAVDSTEPKEAVVAPENEGSVTESITITQDQLNETVAASVKAALEAAGVKPDEHANESAEEKVIREAAEHEAKILEEADAIRAKQAGPVGITPEQVKEMIGEAVKTTSDALTEAFEAQRDKDRKNIRDSGARKGLVLTESTEEVYGGDEPDLTGLSVGDLQKLADNVASPLIATR